MTEEKKQVQTAPEKKPQQPKKQPVNEKLYNKFIELHFLVTEGATLKENNEKEYHALKKEIEACDGKKPKVNRTCSFKDGVVKLAKGIPVPSEVYELVKKNAKKISFYF